MRLNFFLVALGWAIAGVPAVAASDGDAKPLQDTQLTSDQWYLTLDVTGDKEPSFARSLFVQEYGEGSPIIMIHGGFGAEHSYMLPLGKPLSDTNRVIFYDQRGSLRSR